jgi:hypothetical protein
VLWIIDHDMHEVFHGDRPGNMKLEKDFSKLTPDELIVKACDIAETYCHIYEYGVGRHSDEVRAWVANQLEACLSHMFFDGAATIRNIVDDITEGELVI